LYGAATALLLPSLAPEVFPLSILEAFACGTPAIVHNAGGSREAIDQTGGGFVYQTSDELRRAVCLLAEDSTLRDDLGRRAQDGYQQHYSRARYLDGYLDLIHTIKAAKQGIVVSGSRR
jgi:glycosyltransferase involved in cell wall biosynthesis